MDPVLVGFGDEAPSPSLIRWGHDIATMSGAVMRVVSVLDAMAEERPASMVVVGSNDVPLDDSPGTFADRILEVGRHRALAVVPASFEPLEGGHFVVGVDGTKASSSALRRAAQIAHAAHGTLTAAFAYDPLDDTFVLPEGWHRHSDDVRAQIARVRSVPVELVMDPGTPVDVLCDVADRVHAAAVIVGTRTHRAFGRHRGHRVPLHVLHKGSCPTIAVPH